MRRVKGRDIGLGPRLHVLAQIDDRQLARIADPRPRALSRTCPPDMSEYQTTPLGFRIRARDRREIEPDLRRQIALRRQAITRLELPRRHVLGDPVRQRQIARPFIS